MSASEPRKEASNVIDLDHQTRRRFLKVLSGSAVGSFAIPRAIKRVTGSNKEGIPLVWTRDRFGNPDRVRYIPKERYRRLKVYENLDPQSFIDKHPFVNEIGINRRSEEETDLAITLCLDKNTYKNRWKLPNRIKRVPVEYKERPMEMGYKGDSTTSSCSANATDNNCRVNDSYDTLEGNIEISDESSNGTLAVVAWNSNPEYDYKVLITADHVMDSSSTMYQSGTAVGDFWDADSSMDATKYELKSGISANVRETVEASQPTITGTWDFSGLTDATDSGATVPCSFAGAQTCYTETECNDTSKNEAVTYEADMKNVVTEFGDSGGPFVDNNGKLVCTLTGCQEAYLGGEYYYWDRGPVGTEMLNSIGAQLYDPNP